MEMQIATNHDFAKYFHQLKIHQIIFINFINFYQFSSKKSIKISLNKNYKESNKLKFVVTFHFIFFIQQ